MPSTQLIFRFHNVYLCKSCLFIVVGNQWPHAVINGTRDPKLVLFPCHGTTGKTQINITFHRCHREG